MKPRSLKWSAILRLVAKENAPFSAIEEELREFAWNCKHDKIGTPRGVACLLTQNIAPDNRSSRGLWYWRPVVQQGNSTAEPQNSYWLKTEMLA